MGLSLALAAHRQDNIDEALIQYSRAFDQDIKDWRLYQNYGALLREKGEFDKATVVYKKGLDFYPLHIGIIGNYANLCSSVNPTKSLGLFLLGLHVCLSDPKKYPSELPLFYSYVLDRLIDLKLYHWASSLLSRALYHVGATPSLLKNLLILLSEPSFNNRLKSLKSEFEYLVLDSIDKCSDVDAIALYFAIANYYRMLCDHVSSAKYYDLAMKRASFAPGILADDRYKLQHLVDVHSWNCSSLLLQSGNFERGWSLFEYGLRCPADGTQKWQRALIKPFTSDQLPLWTGQCGVGKHLLLLEEQAIGDVIMFVSLIPLLFEEFALIGLLTSIRLAPILHRSFSSEITAGKFVLYTPADIKDGTLSSSNFDFQSAIGSICSKRFTSIDHFAPKVPFLISNSTLTNQFRTEYLKHGVKKDFLVGVSWRGGGRGKRIEEKSMNQDLFKNFLLKHPGFRFVDLQYG
ncbi:TPR domain protein [Synechococcus sp. BL107]|uniref:tetratricopeptide repeat protein n=1 Tax=Synechococcus sp. BL107 TaxID=313625 RepID=UPI0000E53B25|nr:tetratricopeptide repeat protein [Synechococcus sp. BL107]EAU71096.1 TPR domain protein [Synechococcus sp. BL107]